MADLPAGWLPAALDAHYDAHGTTLGPTGTAEDRVLTALRVLVSYGQIDGDHHKTWVIDQAVRALSGGDYDDVVSWANDGEDGPDTYEWDTGIAP